MPKVVSNTTPLLSFIKLNRLDILKELYGEVIIPEAVLNEIERGKDRFYVEISGKHWIKVLKIKNRRILERFKNRLDIGEAEALALAIETKANLLLIDEKIGRKVAKEFNIKFTGTIGILLKAKEQGIIDEVKPYIIELTEKGNYYKESFIRTVLKHAGEI
ncbi:DUF3368 domain-containing protein [Persephonella sp.]|nr:DUF3368 domain-containing protein [Aquificota bacterium]